MFFFSYADPFVTGSEAAQLSCVIFCSGKIVVGGGGGGGGGESEGYGKQEVPDPEHPPPPPTQIRLPSEKNCYF